MPDTIELDHESGSEIDLIGRGLDLYSAHSSTRVFMMAYAINGGRFKHWQAHLDPFPAEAREALEDPDVTKIAFNAQFERVMTNRVLKIQSPVKGWRCTMVHAYLCSFSGSLEDVGEQIGLPPDKVKFKDGKRLINKFSKPQKITKTNPHVWRDWTTDPEDWQQFCEYNVQDCEAERAIRKKLLPYPVPEDEWDLYEIDQIINDRGMPVDRTFVDNAITLSDRRKAELTADMRVLTGLDNPGSPQQLLPWLKLRGYRFNDLQKETVKKELAANEQRQTNGNPFLEPDCVKALKLRQWQARLSVRKFNAIRLAVGDDGNMRFLFQMAGAGRTARWAGRRVQTQNLAATPAGFDGPENEYLLDEAMRIIRNGDWDALKLFVSEPMELLVGTVRGAFAVPDGWEIVSADLKSIESAVIGWLCDCTRLLEVFRNDLDPYKDFATVFYDIPYEAVTKGQRKICKPPSLGCGYRLGGGELVEDKRTGLWGYAENMGVDMTRDESHRAVKLWRRTYFEIPKTWTALEDAILFCMRTREPVQCGKFRFEFMAPFLLMFLPSGRPIFYFQPKMQRRIIKTGRMVTRISKVGIAYEEEETYEKLAFTYMGTHQKTGAWVRIDSHGGRTIEQGTQATAREALKVGMMRAHEDGFPLMGHVHDEALFRHRKGGNYFTLERLIGHLSAPIDFLPGLPLGAAGWAGGYYRKD